MLSSFPEARKTERPTKSKANEVACYKMGYLLVQVHPLLFFHFSSCTSQPYLSKSDHKEARIHLRSPPSEGSEWHRNQHHVDLDPSLDNDASTNTRSLYGLLIVGQCSVGEGGTDGVGTLEILRIGTIKHLRQHKRATGGR